MEKSFGSYEEMLCDVGVQLVYIATPHSHHFEHGMLCLSHGKPVLCEKAFTANAVQAEQMLACAKKKNLLVTEAIWTRYQPMRKLITDCLRSGIIGEPRMLTANLGYQMETEPRIINPDLAGGALLDVGVYPLNFAVMAFGNPDDVQASCVKSEQGVDFCDSITLTWKNGRMAVLTSCVSAISDRFGVIYGTKGFLAVENINNPQAIRVYDTTYQLIQTICCPHQITGYEYELEETARCLQMGKRECPSMPHADTIDMMQLLDEIRRQFDMKFPFEV